jgi:hypothetical protein
MKNVTLAMDERLLEESREYARKHHTTLNAMIRKLLQQKVTRPLAVDWLKELLRIADEGHGNSRGWKWNREEIYDRKVFRRYEHPSLRRG